MSVFLQKRGVIGAVTFSDPATSLPPPDYELLPVEIVEGAVLQDRAEWDYTRQSDTTDSRRRILAQTQGGLRHLLPASGGFNSRALCTVPKTENVRVRVSVAEHRLPDFGSVSCRIYLKMANRASGSNTPTGIVTRVRLYDTGLAEWEISGTGKTTVRQSIADFPSGPYVMQAEVIGATIRLSIVEDGSATTLGQAAFGDSFSTTNAGLDLFIPSSTSIDLKVSRFQIWNGITEFNASEP